MLYGILTLTFPFVSEGHPPMIAGKTYPYDSRFADLYLAALERELRAASDDELCVTAVRLLGHFDLAGPAHTERLRRLVSTLFTLSDDCKWITSSEVPSPARDFELGCGLSAITRFPEGACINTDDLMLYLSHPDDIEKIASPLSIPPAGT